MNKIKIPEASGDPTDRPANHSGPSYLGIAVLARHDPTRPFLLDNCYFRTAVSEEEAEQGSEVYIGAALRDRFLELERQGWIQLDSESRQKVMQLGNEC